MIVKGKVKRLLSSFSRTVKKNFRWSSYKSRVLICVFDLSGSCVSKEGGYTCVCQGKNFDTYSEKYNINFFTVKEYKLPRYVSLNCQKKIVKCVLRNVLKCKVNFFIENIFILVCKEKIKPSLFFIPAGELHWVELRSEFACGRLRSRWTGLRSTIKLRSSNQGKNDYYSIF